MRVPEVVEHTLQVGLLTLLIGAVTSLVTMWPSAVILMETAQQISGNFTTTRLDDFYWSGDVHGTSTLVSDIWLVWRSVVAALTYTPIIGLLLWRLFPTTYPTKVAFVTITLGCALHGVLNGLSAVLNTRGRVSVAGVAVRFVVYLWVVVFTVGVAAFIGQKTKQHYIKRTLFAYALFAGFVVFAYNFLIFSVFFSSENLVVLFFLRVVVHTFAKVIHMSITFRIADRLTQARPEEKHLLFLPTLVYTTAIGRIVQVANANAWFVIVTEVALVVVELNETYGYLNLNRPFALIRDIYKHLRRRSTSLTVVTSTAQPQAILIGEVPATQHMSTTFKGEEPSNPPAMFGRVVGMLAVAEGAVTVAVTIFLLIANVDLNSEAGNPVSKWTVLRNGLIVLFFEVGLSDFVVTLANSFYRDHLFEADVMASWKTRKRGGDWVMLFIIVVITATVVVNAFSQLCVLAQDQGHTLHRCSG